MPLNLLIALAAITMPADVAYEPPACPLPALQAVAVGLELLDSRECKWYFVSEGSRQWDVMELRRRWADLRDAPPLCDAIRFPDLEACRQMLDFNRKHRQWLENHALLYPHETWIAEAIGECDRLYSIWDDAADLGREYYVYWKRFRMKKIREAIGPHLYYAGCLPAPIPVGYLDIID